MSHKSTDPIAIHAPAPASARVYVPDARKAVRSTVRVLRAGLAVHSVAASEQRAVIADRLLPGPVRGAAWDAKREIGKQSRALLLAVAFLRGRPLASQEPVTGVDKDSGRRLTAALRQAAVFLSAQCSADPELLAFLQALAPEEPFRSDESQRAHQLRSVLSTWSLAPFELMLATP